MSDYPWSWVGLQRHIDLCFAALQKHQDDRFSALQHQMKELKTMSGTLAEQLTAATVAIRQDVANVSAEVTQLLAGMTPGTTITQQMVDDLTAIDASLKAIPPVGPTA
jgi:paraquat-inducible protein B